MLAAAGLGSVIVATPPNLVVDSAIRHAGFAGFRLFSFTPFWLAILVAGIGYMLIARRWLSVKGRHMPFRELATHSARPYFGNTIWPGLSTVCASGQILRLSDRHCRSCSRAGSTGRMSWKSNDKLGFAGNCSPLVPIPN